LLYTWVRAAAAPGLVPYNQCRTCALRVPHISSHAEHSQVGPAGDIIDGWNPKDRAHATLDALVAEFDRSGKPHYHIIGNHCLYNLSRQARSDLARRSETRLLCLISPACAGSAGPHQWPCAAHGGCMWHGIMLNLNHSTIITPKRQDSGLRVVLVRPVCTNTHTPAPGAATRGCPAHEHGQPAERQALNERLRMGGPGGASYYAFTPVRGWRMVILDAYDISLLGWPPGEPRHAQAVATLDAHNPNTVRLGHPMCKRSGGRMPCACRPTALMQPVRLRERHVLAAKTGQAGA